VEDEVHWLLAHEQTKKWIRHMLRGSFKITGADNLAKMAATLRPRCKLPDVALDVIFQLRSQVHVALQPVHCAVLLSSSSVVRKLLIVAKRLDALSCYSTEEDYISVSPLLLAVLFADQDVVNALRSHGACFNRVDAIAATRLQVAHLWADLQERLSHLQLDAEAEQLTKMVDELWWPPAEQAPGLDDVVTDVHDM
jgi:hypothetical protein